MARTGPSTASSRDKPHRGGPGALKTAEKRQRAAELVAMGKSNVEVTAELGMNRTTLAKWKHDEAFAAEVARVSAAIYDRARAYIQGTIQEMLEVLRAIATNPGEKSVDRIAAAKELLRLAGLREPDVSVTVNAGHVNVLAGLNLRELAPRQLAALVGHDPNAVDPDPAPSSGAVIDVAADLPLAPADDGHAEDDDP